MACLKALTHSTNLPSYGKTLSFSEDTSTPQMRQMRCNLIGKSHSLPLELYPILKSANSNRDLFGCESCPPAEDLDSMFHNLNTCVNRMCTNMINMAKDSNNFILSAFAAHERPSCAQQCLLVTTAAPAVNERSTHTQQDLLVKTAAAEPVNPSVLENNSLSVATMDYTCDCSVLGKETMHDNNTETPTSSLSNGESNLTCSNSNLTMESSQPIGMSSFDKSCLHESNYSSSGSQNCKIQPTVSENTSQSALQPILNLTSVLSAPRKIVKKGRPSSKKRKKRQREKQKRGLEPLQMKENPDSTHAGCDTEQRLHFQSKILVCDQRNKLESSTVSPCNPKFETAHEAVKPTCTMARLFGRLTSCSEDENCFEDDDDDDDLDNENDSVSKHKEVPCPPLKGFGFSCSLDLDAIFNKSIPESLFSARKKTVADKKTDYALCNDNGLQKNICQSSSDHGSLSNSSTTSALPVLKDADSCFFTPALSLDILFSKKPGPCSQTGGDRKETCDFLDGWSSDENVELLSSSHSPDSESLKKINALWNENYPTAGFRSCSSVSADEIQHPTIKVNFAAEPHLLTVHIVGTEERNGNWHHVIRERENFERRILELEQILTPVLRASHRAKVLEQRKSQEQQ